MFHTRQKIGTARVVKMEITKVDHLTKEFCRHDGDCSREDFYKLMEGWYSKKPDWKGWDSEVQVLHCEWVTK